MNALFLIKRLKIRNVSNNYAISKIRLSMGNKQSIINKKWYKLCNDIENIKSDSFGSQWYEFNSLINAKQIYWEQLNLIKLEILKNHGSDKWNIFYSFSVYGKQIY